MKETKFNAADFQAPTDIINRWRTLALGVGGIFTIIWAIGTFFNVEQGLRSWLLGFIFWGGIGFGSLGILLLQYLTGGAWGVVIRRFVEAGSRTIPIIFILFLPILIGVSSLYEWTHLNDRIVQARQPYLSVEWWIFRAILYFILFYLMAHFLNKWSWQQDQTDNYKDSAKFLGDATKFSGPTMIFFVVVVSFAAIDWVMTLDPHFYSTIWGFLFVAGWALSCFCFMVAIMASLIDKAPMSRILGKRHFHDIGKLMLALVMVWAYFNFSQYLIIYSGNLPEETFWYITRQEGAWGVIGLILIVFHFAFPFLVLLSRDLKRDAKWLKRIAIFILVLRLVDMYYIIGPSPRIGMHGQEVPFSLSFSWMDLVAPVAVGGIWLWWFFGELLKRPLVPINDPFLENAIEHGKH
jgi:hypothetical protein